MKQDFTTWRNQILQNPQNISPLKFGMSQDEVIEIFGKPDAVSTMRSDGKPLILKYHDIELHFDRKAPHGLYLVYSDDEIELCITDHHEELLQPITNIEPVDNEFFLQDGAVYFSGLYENGLLKGVAPKDFCCWHYWGKSSTACFLGGIRLRGADPASFRVLNYAYGKQLSKADLPSWELLGHWYSRDAKRVYYLSREIKGADWDSFAVCTPLDAPPLADHLARDKEHFYQNDEMIEEPLWLERLHELTPEK